MLSFLSSLFLGSAHPANRSRRILAELSRQGIDADRNQQELVNLLCRQVHGKALEQSSGVYIYGPPGRGKSMILDALVSTLEPQSSARFHFHEFFHVLNTAGKTSGSQALGSVFMRGLERELEGIGVLCFDEFHCVEPGDAMFMARLVSYCQEKSITLITTSNYAPDQLLDDPYFHHLIEPTIEKITSRHSIFELDMHVDYRTLSNPTRQVTGYRAGSLSLDHPPVPQAGQEQMLKVGYDSIGPGHIEGNQLHISFDQLCRTRRNTRDYIELAAVFTRWTITGIPASTLMPMDEQRRLANLIDVLYDRDIEVHLHGADYLQALGEDLPQTERARLTSRLSQLGQPQLTEDRKY